MVGSNDANVKQHQDKEKALGDKNILSGSRCSIETKQCCITAALFEYAILFLNTTTSEWIFKTISILVSVSFFYFLFFYIYPNKSVLDTVPLFNKAGYSGFEKWIYNTNMHKLWQHLKLIHKVTFYRSFL